MGVSCGARLPISMGALCTAAGAAAALLAAAKHAHAPPRPRRGACHMCPCAPAHRAAETGASAQAGRPVAASCGLWRPPHAWTAVGCPPRGRAACRGEGAVPPAAARVGWGCAALAAPGERGEEGGLSRGRFGREGRTERRPIPSPSPLPGPRAWPRRARVHMQVSSSDGGACAPPA